MNKKLLSIIALILVMCFVLVGCGEPVNNAPTTHEHTFESGDNWEKNATGHWHKALCDHKEVIADFDDHNDDNDDGVCDDCGYSDPNHTHTFGDTWYFDNAKHWNKSTCKHTGVIGNEAPHTPDILGVCTVCGVAVSTPSVDSVEEALEFGTLMKDKVAGGTIVENEDVTASYEFRDGYLYIERNSYGFVTNIYYTPDKDGNVLGVLDSEYGTERVDAVEANLWGPQIDTWFMGGLDDNIYGIEHLLTSLYEIGSRNENGDFTEEITVYEGETVCLFGFGYYNAGSLYYVEAAFSLDETNYFINNAMIMSTEYFGENVKEVVPANGDKPAQYAPIDETDIFASYYIMASQDSEINAENPFNPDDVLMKDFDLMDSEGNIIENGTLTIERGEPNDFIFMVVAPDGTNFWVNSITFSGENVNDYMPESLSADYYAGDDFFTLYSEATGSFTLIMNVNGVDYEYNVVVVEPTPTDIYAGVVEDHWVTTEYGDRYPTGNYIIVERDSVEINMGDVVVLASHADKRIAIVNVAINTEIDIDPAAYGTIAIYDEFSEKTYNSTYIDLSYLPVGEYIVTFTAADDSTLTKSINVKVNEKAEGEDPTGPELDGSGTDVDPFLIGATGSFVAKVPSEGTVYYVFTAPAADTYTFKFSGDFWVEIGTNPMFPDIMTPASVTEKSFTLEAGESVYVAVSAYESFAATIDFTIKGANDAPGGEEPEPEEPEIVEEGKFTLTEVSTEFGIGGEYTYTIDSEGIITVYKDGVESTDVIFIYDEMLGQMMFNSNNPTIGMTVQGAMLATEDGMPITKLEGKVVLGSKRGIIFEFNFTKNGGEEPNPDPDPDPDPEKPEIVEEGKFTLTELTTEFGIGGEYTYTIDSEGIITVYKDGVENTDVMFIYDEMFGQMMFNSNNPTIGMTVQGAMLATEDGMPITELGGKVLLGSKRGIYFEFNFTKNGEEPNPDPEPDPEPEEPKVEMTGTGLKEDPFVINGEGSFTIPFVDKSTYVTFVATETWEVSFYINGNADMVKADGTNRFARPYETYTVILQKGESFAFFLGQKSGTEMILDITTSVAPYKPEIPENNAVMNSMLGKTFDIGSNSYNFYQDNEGYYLIDVNDDSYSKFATYYFEITEVNGKYKLTLAAKYEDSFGIIDAEIFMESNVLVDWLLYVNGNTINGDPVKEALSGEAFTVGDINIGFGYDWENDTYIIEAYLNDGNYNFVNYGYKVRDNGDGTFTVSAEPVAEDTLGLASKTIVLTRTAFDTWTITVDGVAPAGNVVGEALNDFCVSIENYEFTFGKDYETGVYFILISDLAYSNFRNYTYAITDNGDGTYTLTFTGIMYDGDDCFKLLERTLTASYTDKKWNVTISKATEPETPVEPPVSIEDLTDEERMGIEKIAETYREFKDYIKVVMEEYAKFKASDAYKKVEKPEMTEEERANIEKLVSRWELPEDTKKGLMEHFFNSLNSLKAKLYEEQTIKTIKEALEASVGDRVILTGVVKATGTNTTIADEEGNTITVYKLGTTVALGDTIVVTGVIAVNSGVRVVAEGATAEIKEAHGDNHKYESGKCILCGKEEPKEGEKSIKIDFTTMKGEPNTDETYKIEDLELTTNGGKCSIEGKLILVKGGYIIIAAPGTITKIEVNIIGTGSFSDGTVKASTDKSTFNDKIKPGLSSQKGDVNTVLTVDESKGYTFIKIETLMGIHIKDITITYMA